MPMNQAGAGQTLDASLNTIITEFKLLQQESGVVKGTATHYTLEPHSGVSKIVLNYGRLVGYGVAEGVDIVQAQALADTQTAYTPSEVAVQVLISDRTVDRVADPALMRQIGRMMSNAYDVKQDSDGVAQFSSFTMTLGAAATVATPGHVGAAAARLRLGGTGAIGTTAEPAPKPWYGVISPNALQVIESKLVPLAPGPGNTGSNAAGVVGITQAAGAENGMSEAVLRGNGAGMLYGFTVLGDGNIVNDVNDDSVSGWYSKEGMIYVEELAPTEERQRDASLRAWELNIVGSYAFGVYRAANFGVALTTDSIAPTS